MKFAPHKFVYFTELQHAIEELLYSLANFYNCHGHVKILPELLHW